MNDRRQSTPSEPLGEQKGSFRARRTVVVNDLMQRGYTYSLTAPPGDQFALRLQARSDAGRDARAWASLAVGT